MPRDWRSVVDEMTTVQKKVHLAIRYDDYDVDRMRAEMLKEARRIFEGELVIQAGRIGCTGRSAYLGNGGILSEINDLCEEWAASIVNTYNYDAAGAILNIASEAPRANRHVYAKRLEAWEEKRNSWKAPQIAQFTEGSIRSLAQSYFVQYNAPQGFAILEPDTAVCPVCQGWIDRGEVPIRVAMANPGPWHPNCPHLWMTYYSQFSGEDCQMLWMGE